MDAQLINKIALETPRVDGDLSIVAVIVSGRKTGLCLDSGCKYKVSLVKNGGETIVPGHILEVCNQNGKHAIRLHENETGGNVITIPKEELGLYEFIFHDFGDDTPLS